MRPRTVRRIGNWTKKPIPITADVLGVLGFIFTAIGAFLDLAASTLLYVGIALLVAAISIAAIAAWRENSLRGSYFRKIEYPSLSADEQSAVVEQLVTGLSATSEFALVAPTREEFSSALDLAVSGELHIHGGPGSGKSTLAHQVAKHLWNTGYHVYLLYGDALTGTSQDALQDELHGQLDALRGSVRLIIVDDAQGLEYPDEYLAALRRAVAEEDTSFIWIETKILVESFDVSGGHTIHLDYSNVVAKQVEFFLERGGEAGSVAEASRLVDLGVITNPWQFAFAASHGEATLLRALDDLNNAELLALFLLSVHFVAFRRQDITFTEAQELLARIPLLWFHDDMRLSNMRALLVTLLSGNDRRRPLLVAKKHGNAGTWISPLHYNFARQVVRTSLVRSDVTIDFLGLSGALLPRDARRAPHLAALCNSIGPDHLPSFLRLNEPLLTEYVRIRHPDGVRSLAALLQAIRLYASEHLELIVVSLDIERLGLIASLMDPSGLSELSKLPGLLGSRQLGFVSSLDVAALASSASRATVGELAGVAKLVSALGSRRGEFLAALDVPALAGSASAVTVGGFAGVAELVSALGSGRGEFLAALDVPALAGSASAVTVGGFAGVAQLVSVLGARRGEFLAALDVPALAGSASTAAVGGFAGVAQLASALGARRGEFLAALDVPALAGSASTAAVGGFAGVAKLSTALGSRRGEFLAALDVPALAGSASATAVGGWSAVAELVHALDARHGEFVTALDVPTLAGSASAAAVGGWSGVAELVHALDARRGEFLTALDVPALASSASRAAVGEWSGVAQLVTTLDTRRGEFLTALDVPALASSASRAAVGEWSAVAHLVTTLDTRRGEFLATLDVPTLAGTASQATPRQVQTIAAFLDILETTQRQIFLRHLDHSALAAVLSDAGPGELQCIAQLVAAVPEIADQLVDHMDVPKIAGSILSSHTIHAHQLRLLLRSLDSRAQELLGLLTVDPEPFASCLAVSSLADLAEIGALIRGTPEGKRLIGQHLNLAQCVELARHGSALDLQSITIFAAALGDEERAEFASKVNWAALLADVRIINATIQAIGQALMNAARYSVDQIAARRTLEGWIAEKTVDLRRVVRSEYAIIRGSGGTQARRYAAVSVLLIGVSEVSIAHAVSLAESTRRSLRRSMDKNFADDESLRRLLETLKTIAPGEYEDLQ
jgi:hypothetical protein